MKIRNYTDTDEKKWLKCRLLSFYDCSYYDNVLFEKEKYNSKSINLVAVEDDTIIGFIDIEVESEIGEVCCSDGELGRMIWDLGVLPEHRTKKVASLLLEKAISIAKEMKITRFEAFTQDDVASNKWYLNKGFKYVDGFGYLNVYGGARLVSEDVGEILGVRSVNFEAPLERKSELTKKFKRVHEVRMYELKF